MEITLNDIQKLVDECSVNIKFPNRIKLIIVENQHLFIKDNDKIIFKMSTVSLINDKFYNLLIKELFNYTIIKLIQ